MKNSLKRSAIPIYLILFVLFSAAIYFLIIKSGHVGSGNGQYVTAIMWCPGLAALLTCWLCKIPVESLGWRWAGTRMQMACYLLPLGYALVAYTVIWVTGLGSVPSPKFLQDCVKYVGVEGVPPLLAALLMIFLSAVFGFIRGCALALGEEIGWRGFLAPKLFDEYGFGAACLVTGLIWGLWHYPAFLYADYYRGAAPMGYALACFTVQVIGSSIIATWFRLRTQSIWAVTFLHASHNTFIQMIFTPLTGNTGTKTSYAIDEYGFVVPLTIGICAIWFWLKRDIAIKAYQEASMKIKKHPAGAFLTKY